MNLSSGLRLDPAVGPLSPHSAPQAGSGVVVARVFLDRNRDGHWDAGEPPIEGAGVGVDGGEALSTTGLGLAVLTNLTGYAPVSLMLFPDSLTDPLWMPRRQGAQVVPRPGRTMTVDFPVVTVGEVNGTVYLRRGGKPRELAGVELALTDGEGRVVKTTRSAYDGFYTFTQLPPGTYRLRVPPEQFTTRHLAPPIARDIIIGPDGNMLDGLDFTMELTHDQPPHPAPKAKPIPRPKQAARGPGAARPAVERARARRQPPGRR
jgi:hypothetical protein